MHVFVELRINQPGIRAETAVTAGLQLIGGEGGRERRDLPPAQKGIVSPLHKLAPDLGRIRAVQIDLVVNERQPLERRHRAEEFPAPVHQAHAAFVVNILRGLFVKPHEIQRAPLKLFSPLIAGFEPDHRNAAERVPDVYLVDHAHGGRVLSPGDHGDVRDPPGIQIVQYFRLRHVALHLRGEGNHPAEDIRLIFPVGMNAPREPDGLHRAAFRLSAAVAAENPPVLFPAAVKQHLFSVFFLPRVVERQGRRRGAARLFRLDRADSLDQFPHFDKLSPFL